MIPATGQRVGPYEILGRLGRGGMGLVFSAWDSRLHRDVAIKLLREEFIHGDSHERFLTEARAASGLNHPNICTVFDIGEQDGNPYLVMELLKGETLRARISSSPMSLAEILGTGIEIADALSAAHARGIIHRDVKPANIFLVAKTAGGWQAKVLDFGLAKIELADGLDPRYQMTGAGSAVGTVAYMSPEQARGEELDARSDLFALGIVLYEIATGHVPFEGITSALIFVQLLGHAPHPVREFNPGFPRDFERIILKLLSKDRSDRYQSALELLEALRKLDLKKPSARASLFSKPTAWVRNSVLHSSPSKTVPPPSAAHEVAASPSADSSKSSGEALTIRPVRRQPLPPTELAASAEHWTRPPRLSGIRAATESSGTCAAAVAVTESSSSADVRSEPAVETAGKSVSTGNHKHVQPHSSSSHKWVWALVAVGVVAMLSLATSYSKKRFRPAVAHQTETFMLASIANHTGDKTLGGVVLEGLRLDLAQSPYMTVPEVRATMDAARSATSGPADLTVPADARRVATVLNAQSFLSGEIHNEGGSTIISVQINNAVTGAMMMQAEETAGSREQIADAIDRLSAQVRIALGEAGEAVAHSSVPLARDATSNVDALEAYVAGSEAQAEGHGLDAMMALQHAVTVEPKFTQAWLQLAALYRSEHAEVAAADAATRAKEASVGTSQRTRVLAEASYQLHATADYSRALALLDQVAKSYPLDSSIQAERALLLRAQGQFPEALETAQNVLSRNPYNVEATEQAVYAMLALERSDAAHIVVQAEQRGQHHPELRNLLASLNIAGSEEDATVPGVESGRLRADPSHAELLDASGQLAAGLASWRAAASNSRGTPALLSAASYVLAQAALNRALTSDCASSAMLVNEASALPRGQTALFEIGMAQGLCGDVNGTRGAVLELMSQYPQSFAVKRYVLANLTAIDQIRSGDSDAALATLQAAKQYDLLSLAPYLRGLAHSNARQWPLAIADYQFVLLHRGASTQISAPLYAMSQLGLARAYAASGDKGNSATAYAAFLATWKAADPANPLVIEAHKHSM